MDRSLIILGTVIAVSLASAAMWYLIVKSYAWAVGGSSLTVGLVTLWGYPLYRGLVPNALVLVNAVVLGAMISFGVGIPFKRRRVGREKASDDA
jgi:hypothetical protein